jgi:hypothetical protein
MLARKYFRILQKYDITIKIKYSVKNDYKKN